MKKNILIAGLACASIFCHAATVFVAPEGVRDADGSAARPLNIFAALGGSSPARPGDEILLRGGTYEGHMEGKKRIPFEWAVSGEPGKPVTVRPADGASVHLNGTAKLTGSHVRYVGLEVGDLRWDPYGKTHQCETALWAIGGEGAQVINCNFFGGSMGSGLWSPARNLTVYGCLFHDFGTLTGQGRGHGHAFYTQNETGTKTIEQCIAYRGCGWNLHAYTQRGQIRGFDVLDNIMYIAGAYKPGQTMDNFLVAGHPPADRIRLLGNVGYQPSDVQSWRPNARLGNYKPALNGTGEICNNTFIGAYYGVSLGNWRDLTMTNNTVWSSGIHVEVNSAPTGSGIGRVDAKPDPAGYTIDGNTYIANGSQKTFYHGNAEKIGDDEQKMLFTFEKWQALGFDRNGEVSAGRDGKPAGTRVFVFPNRYTRGRANVAVFDWDGNGSVDVDPGKTLNKGQAFRVYNCLDIKQTIAAAEPVLRAVYDGEPVAFPMRHSEVSPEFDAFLVLPGE